MFQRYIQIDTVIIVFYDPNPIFTNYVSGRNTGMYFVAEQNIFKMCLFVHVDLMIRNKNNCIEIAFCF